MILGYIMFALLLLPLSIEDELSQFWQPFRLGLFIRTFPVSERHYSNGHKRKWKNKFSPYVQLLAKWSMKCKSFNILVGCEKDVWLLMSTETMWYDEASSHSWRVRSLGSKLGFSFGYLTSIETQVTSKHCLKKINKQCWFGLFEVLLMEKKKIEITKLHPLSFMAFIT